MTRRLKGEWTTLAYNIHTDTEQGCQEISTSTPNRPIPFNPMTQSMNTLQDTNPAIHMHSRLRGEKKSADCHGLELPHMEDISHYMLVCVFAAWCRYGHGFARICVPTSFTMFGAAS